MGRLHLGSILGTTITLDFSFILFAGLWVFSYIDQWGMPGALIWLPVLFISLVVHELAHAATIGAFGFGPSAVVLGGIGGATYNQRQAKPWQDLLISAAGPASSFLLALAVRQVPAMRDPFFQALLPLLVIANFVWALFNLLPVGPLDGANMLRNFLRLFLADAPAFVISVWTSIIVGILVALVAAKIREPFLILLMAWYVWSSWQQWQFFRRTYRGPDA